jgi:hypothetical protein
MSNAERVGRGLVARLGLNEINWFAAIVATLGIVTICIGWPMWCYYAIGKPAKERHDSIYNACIADGQKPYYCESLASSNRGGILP